VKRAARSERAGQDRWLVSYADLVTLLFAFFTTLYAAQAVDVTAAGTPAPASSPGTADAPAPVSAPSASEAGSAGDVAVDSLRARLTRRLEDDMRLMRADIVRDERGLVVSLPERATFAAGSADVTAEAKPLIAKVVEELGTAQYALRIEGHTDDRPIHTARFPSNWELSTARAGAVVAYLIQELEVSPSQLSAAGYAEFHPLVDNSSIANRARNRRIDIVVIDQAETAGEPGTR
jgi:chemotaxis protein MotB